MANLQSKDQRHVIPNWRKFEVTVKLGELNGFVNTNLVETYKPEISDLLDDWETTKTIGVAADILGIAISSSQVITQELEGIARFVLQNEERASNTLIRTSKRILEIDNTSTRLDDSPELDPSLRPEKLYISIALVKKSLKINPRNAIAWIELGRLYSILGLDNKAERAILNAIYLAPENRFVLRSMARFYSHFGNVEFADKFLKKAEITKYDPWVMASSIALSDLRGINSKFTKNGLRKIESDSFNPFSTSELSSAIATLELEHGNLKTSKKLFRKSLVNPNDNALAQAEWASQKEIKLDQVNPSQFNLESSHEALARDYYEKQEWEYSIELSTRWFLDMPYSKQAINFGYDIALHKLKDYGRAAEIGKMGLLSHPNDPFLINNIMYNLALKGDITQAENLYGRIKHAKLETGNSTNICLIATKGLIKYRKGDIKRGKELYLKAIQTAKKYNNLKLANLALVNLAREEIIHTKTYDIEIINKLQEIKEKSLDADFIELINDVINLKDKIA